MMLLPPCVYFCFAWLFPCCAFRSANSSCPSRALEKRLYLREQDAGQGLHFVIGYPGAVVVDFPLGAAPVLEPFLVEQVSLRYGAVPSASARGHIEEDRIRRFAV